MATQNMAYVPWALHQSVVIIICNTIFPWSYDFIFSAVMKRVIFSKKWSLLSDKKKEYYDHGKHFVFYLANFVGYRVLRLYMLLLGYCIH